MHKKRKLEGQDQRILKESDQKLTAAREARKEKRRKEKLRQNRRHQLHGFNSFVQNRLDTQPGKCRKSVQFKSESVSIVLRVLQLLEKLAFANCFQSCRSSSVALIFTHLFLRLDFDIFGP